LALSDLEPGWKSIPVGGVIPKPGSAAEYRTGDWRTYRPVIDKEKCINCLLCWIYCPDASILQTENKVEVDYEHCKGCGICAQECPVKAIIMEEE